ncbi:MAG: hypothetical protein IT584_00055 [Chlamydiae bacterium]|nr:hypothetical protein [Chlamydiota bacterium]
MPLASVNETRKRSRFFDRSSWDEEPSSGIDEKVQGLVKRKIASGLGSLLVSVAAPFLLPELRSSIRNIFRSEKKSSSRFETISDQEQQIPLGLIACGMNGWINALMQIALRLPIYRTILLLWAPQSYEPFQRFIDQHDADQRAKLEISSASSLELVQCLIQKMSSECICSDRPDFFEIFRILLLSGSPKRSFFLKLYSKQESSCLVEWDAKTSPFFTLMDQKLQAHTPGHLLVFVKNKEAPGFVVPKQIVDGKGQYYDLQGFIERRSDAGSTEFIAYVKVSGKTWYQCRDQRISKMNSIHLHVPLLLSHVLYYKKCS